MRKAVALIVFLGLVAASFLWPFPEMEPPAEPPPASVPTGGILGRVTRNGYPAVARIEVRRVGAQWADGCVGRERGHLLERIHRAWVGTGDPVATAESDETGRFRIGGLPPAVYDLRARTGDGTTGQWWVRTGSGEVIRRTFDLRATGLMLLGRVRWSDGSPFAGEVCVSGRGVRTAADGRFVLRDLRRHREPIYARIPGEISRIIGTFDPDGEDRIDAVVDHGLVRRDGRVVSAEDGRPLGGVVVRASWVESRRWCTSATRSQSDGTVRILCTPDADLAAGGDEYVTERAGVVRPDMSISFRMRRRPRVEGRVVTPDGKAAPGAEVWLLGLPRHPGEDPSREWRAPVLADGDGRFRFASPVAGFATVLVLGGGWVSRDLPPGPPADYNSLAVRLPAGERVELELTAVRSASVAGRVVDHEGRPVAGIRVDIGKDLNPGTAFHRIGDVLGDECFAVTGPDGRYRIPTVKPGSRWTISTRPPVGFAVTSEPIRPDGEQTVDLALPAPPDRWVEVEVVSAADGRPVHGAGVSMVPQDAEATGPLSWRGGDDVTRSDGRSLLGPFPDGPLVARVSHAGYVTRSDVTVPMGDGGPWPVRLEPGKALAGYVRFPDGTPAAGAFVLVYKDDDLVSEMRADAVGGFALRSLASGRYRIWSYGAAPDGSVPQVRMLARAGSEDLVLNLEPAPPPGQRIPRDDPRAGPVRTGRLEGRVLDDAGRPVRGTCVSIRSKSERAPWPSIPTVVWTDADGRFAFDCTADRHQVLRVLGPPHLVLPMPVHATAGDEEVEIRLAKAAQPVVTVIDGAGAAVPGVAVYLLVPGRRPVGHLADHRGQVRLGSLVPERAYHLRLDPPEDREDLRRTNLQDWNPADRLIRLQRVWTLRGVVRDRDGYPVGHASFWFRAAGKEEAEWTQVEVGGDGRFEVARVPATDLDARVGVSRLTADAAGLAPRRIHVGDDPVEIDIDGGTWIGLHVPDWPAAEPGRVSLSWRGGVRRLPMPKSGRVRFHGVPGMNDSSLHVGPTVRGRMAFADDLHTGIDHELPLRPGHAITGRILGPGEIELFHMSIYGTGIALRYDLNEDTPTARYRVAGLPEGEYLFSIQARVGDVYYRGEIEVRTGEPMDMKLKRSGD